MTTQLTAQRIRLACVLHSHTPLVDLLVTPNAAPVIWRGTNVIFDLGLFVGSTIIDSKANIASLYLEIHSPRSSAPLIQKEIVGSTLDVTVSGANWTDGTKQNVSIELTAAETQFDLTDGNDDKRTFWVVVHIVTNDVSPKKITCGAAQLIVEEDGAQNDLAVVPMSNPAFRISSGELQLWNPDTSKWHTVSIRGAAGAETLAIAGGAS